jgi:hypothetical protein
MSVELMVLSERRVASMPDWQQAIDMEGLSVTLAADASIEMLDGFLPVRSSDTQTGFECDHCEVEEILTLYPNVNFGRRWSYGLVFRWGGDLDACLAASISAAAYAKASGGVVFDPQEGSVTSFQEAFIQAKEMRR